MAVLRKHSAVALIVLAFTAVPVAAAQDITLTTRTYCKPLGQDYKWYAVYAGRSMKGQFKGPWADYIKSAVSPVSGITGTLSNPVSNWSNSTLDVVFRTDADVDSPRGISVVVEPILQPRVSKNVKPQLWVIPSPALTGSIVPKADYYHTVDVVLTGTNIHGANVAKATARVDGTHPVVGYAGETAQIANGVSIPAAIVGTPTKTETTVRLSLPQKLTKVSLDINITGSNADICSPFGAGPGTSSPPTLSRRVTLAVPAPPAPPYVQRIEVINAKIGRDAEFTITLNKQVPKPGSGISIYWKMSPSNVFSAVAGDASYDSSGGFNRVTMSSGELVKRFKLRVVSLPAGAVNVGTVYIQTWIGDNTKNQPPFFFQKEFTITQ